MLLKESAFQFHLWNRSGSWSSWPRYYPAPLGCSEFSHLIQSWFCNHGCFCFCYCICILELLGAEVHISNFYQQYWESKFVDCVPVLRFLSKLYLFEPLGFATSDLVVYLIYDFALAQVLHTDVHYIDHQSNRFLQSEPRLSS